MNRLSFPLLTFFLALIISVAAPAADFDAGMKAYRNGDHSTAYSEWLPLAKSGHTKAMNNLALLYKNGKGVKRDLKKAFKFFKKSAAQGYPLAQYNLAGMYVGGKGTKKNPKLAYKSMLGAAMNNYNRAQTLVAKWNEKGFGTDPDLVEALAWYLVASKDAGKKRKVTIKKKIVELRKSLTGEEFKEAMSRYKGYRAVQPKKAKKKPTKKPAPDS